MQNSSIREVNLSGAKIADMQWSAIKSSLSTTGSTEYSLVMDNIKYFNYITEGDSTYLKEDNISVAGIFSNMSKLKKISLKGVDTSSWVNMSRMFGGCSSLTSVDLSDFDTSNV